MMSLLKSWILKYALKIIQLIAFIGLVSTTICSYFSLSGKTWIVHDNGEGHGLLLLCKPGIADEHTGAAVKECEKLIDYKLFQGTDLTSWLSSVFVAYVIAAILHMCAAILFIVYLILKSFAKCALTLAFFSIIVAAFSMLIAMSIYTNKFYFIFSMSGYSWGKGFAFGWVCFLLDLSSICILFLLLMLQAERIKLPTKI